MEPADHELLDLFHQRGDEAAFAALVRRYLGLVHAVALRLTGNAGQAEEACQLAFIQLAQTRPGRFRAVPLAAWLHRVTRSRCLDLMRAERRRRREEIAVNLQTTMEERTIEWERISPVLEEVVAALPERDREMILERFYRGKSYGEMAGRLGLSEDAGRMRLRRALERMRALLAKKGIATTTAALALTLPGHAVGPVPAGLAAKVTGAALGAAAKGGFLTIGIMTMSKKAAVAVGMAVALLLVLGAGGAGAFLKERATAHGVVNGERVEIPADGETAPGGPGAGKLGERPAVEEKRERKTGPGYDIFREDGQINFELMDLAGISRDRADDLNELVAIYREQERTRLRKRWVVVSEDRETETRVLVARADPAAAGEAVDALRGGLVKQFGRVAAEFLMPYLESADVVAGSGRYEIQVTLHRHWREAESNGMPPDPPELQATVEIRNPETGEVVRREESSADALDVCLDLPLEGQEPPEK